jgi:hypothetical protein
MCMHTSLLYDIYDIYKINVIYKEKEIRYDRMTLNSVCCLVSVATKIIYFYEELVFTGE